MGPDPYGGGMMGGSMGQWDQILYGGGMMGGMGPMGPDPYGGGMMGGGMGPMGPDPWRRHDGWYGSNGTRSLRRRHDGYVGPMGPDPYGPDPYGPDPYGPDPYNPSGAAVGPLGSGSAGNYTQNITNSPGTNNFTSAAAGNTS